MSREDPADISKEEDEHYATLYYENKEKREESGMNENTEGQQLPAATLEALVERDRLKALNAEMLQTLGAFVSSIDPDECKENRILSEALYRAQKFILNG